MQYTLSTTLTSGSSTVTVSSTNRLFPGLILYSSAVNLCTKILTINSSTQITISQNALTNYSGSVVFSDLTPYKYMQQCEALKDVQNIINNEGMYIKIILREERDLVRDNLNSIKQNRFIT